MALNSRLVQPDEVFKAANSDSGFQVPSMPFRDGSFTGSGISVSELTGVPSAASTGPLHAPPTTYSDHGPYRSLKLPSTTDNIATVSSAGPEEPSVVTIAIIPTITPQPNASSSSQGSGLSKGQIIVAIVFPIIGLLILLPIIIICIYSHRRRRSSKQRQSAREMKTLSPPTRSGWLPPDRRAEVGAARPAPAQMQREMQQPDVIPRRSPTMNSGYYSGLDHSAAAATHGPPATSAEDPPPPYVSRTTAAPATGVEDPPPSYVPRTTAAPEYTALGPPLTQRQPQPATLSEANLVAHGGEGPRSPFADPENDTVSEISNLENGEGRGRERDVDEMSFVSAPDHERHETHPIV